MVIDDSTSLQVGEDRDGAEILKASLFESGTDPVGQVVFGLPFTTVVFRIDVGLVIRKSPDEGIKAAIFLDDLQEAPGIVDDGTDLSPGLDHTLGVQNPINVILRVSGDFMIIKIIEALAEDLPFFQHQRPTQAALHHFQHEKFKMLLIVMEQDAPFLVVVALVQTAIAAPCTASFIHWFHHLS